MKNNTNSFMSRLLLALAILGLIAIPSMARADTDVTAIVTGASAVFTAVATLCVSIGVFFVGYRLAKRVK